MDQQKKQKTMIEIEVELKALIDTNEAADAFRKQLWATYQPQISLQCSSQLNHYFTGGDYDHLLEVMSVFVTKQEQASIASVLQRSTSISLRTREIDGQDALFICKASLDADSSENGATRLEVETLFKGWYIKDLDKLLLAAGCQYQAKWSRDREEYDCGLFKVCLDRNAGYGWLVEFERMVHDEVDVDQTRGFLLDQLYKFGLRVLPSDRLERMFTFYNANWREYYGTANVFEVL